MLHHFKIAINKTYQKLNVNLPKESIMLFLIFSLKGQFPSFLVNIFLMHLLSISYLSVDTNFPMDNFSEHFFLA